MKHPNHLVSLCPRAIRVLGFTLSLALGGAAMAACSGGESPRAEEDDGDSKKKKKKKRSEGDDDDEAKAAGCAKDTDCKGTRVCRDGACVDDPVAQLPTPPPPPAPAPPPAVDPAPPPAPPAPVVAPAPPTLAFTPVEESQWTPRLGPKIKAGSRVVHTVFEGPFGPSPRSLFAVAEHADKSYFVYVMGDDGKGWPAGPLAEVGTFRAKEIKAVSFFDADGDGTTDALVMALYEWRGRLANKNVLLKWTNLGMRRLLKLEPKIEFMTSAADVQRALGR